MSNFHSPGALEYDDMSYFGRFIDSINHQLIGGVENRQTNSQGIADKTLESNLFEIHFQYPIMEILGSIDSLGRESVNELCTRYVAKIKVDHIAKNSNK